LRTFIKNFSSLAVADVGSRLIGFFATAYLARILGVEKFGVINIGFTLLSYGMLATNPGILLYATREVTTLKEHYSSFVGEVLSLRLFLSLVSFLILAVVVKVLFPSQEIFLIVVLFSLFLFPASFLLEWFFQARGEIQRISISRIAGQFVYMGMLFRLVSSNESMHFVPLAWLCSGVVSSAILFFSYKKNIATVQLHFTISSLFKKKGRWREILRLSFPIGLGTWLAQIGTNFPPLIIAFLLSEKEVGYYSAAYKIVFSILVLDRIFFFLFYPIIIKTYHESLEKLQTMLSVSLKIVIAIALPLCVGGTILSHQFIAAIYGDGYEHAASILEVVIWFAFLTIIHSTYAVGLIGIGKEKQFSRTMVIGTIAQMLLVIGGTYYFRSVGAAAGFVVGEGCTLAMMMFQFNNFVQVKLIHSFFRPIVASIGMFCVLFFIQSVPLVISIFLGCIVYMGLFYLIAGITKQDIQILKERFS